MCGICGCAEHDEQRGLEHSHFHEHETGGALDHHTSHDDVKRLSIEEDILAKNNQFATINRNYFKKNKIAAFNMMSSPGAGKTTLLSKTIADLSNQLDMAVIVGDQETDYDAMMIKASGGRAVQINTGRVCHLDAHMIGHSVTELKLNAGNLLFIENVGNLVCPALFDLGETYKVVILSVTEGDNKPLKYPQMFRGADLMIITKIDLLPYVEFDCQRCGEYARRINPKIEILPLSSTQGEGLMSWYEWLRGNFE